ncbi:DUF6541 family protein [Kutzneria kofuensis]|uniref:Uncharacterized protein n=1 Tax=Kutzneria kofuensis TaxID=103725 RepID=A0A7W9KH31_9PSEU|nr:DUF6541 family protein [Kutzneria kofuensis]MBB5892471.1 hypothetical protein [Kutzneria kofuensis]
MNWWDAVPVALASAGWLIVPGLLMTWLVGLRGTAAWGMAPTLSVAVVSTAAVVAGKLGIDWGVGTAAVAVAIAVVVTGVVALLLRGRSRGAVLSDPRPVTLAGLLGVLPAVLFGAAVVVLGMGRPDELSQTFDAVFHYNAIAYILDAHNASSLTMGTLGNPIAPATFYPAGWHDFASLGVLSTGTSIPIAANALTGVLAVLIWPLSCVLLVRQIVGRNPVALAMTGLFSLAFSQFPWGLLSFGVLWPNTLGLALVPAGIAVVLSLSGLAREDLIGRGRAWVMAPFVLLAGGFAHPNSLFSMVVIAVFPLFTGIWRWSRRMRSEGQGRRGTIGLTAAVVVFLLGWAFVATSPAFKTVRTFYWPPFETSSRALGEVLLNGTNGRSSLWAASIAVLVGLVLVWRMRDQRWLVGAFTAIGAMFILTASVNRTYTQFITGYWYNDSFRLAAILPVVTVPLLVVAVVTTAGCLKTWLAERPRPRLGRLGASATGLAIVLALLVIVGAKGLYFRNQVETVAFTYTRVENSPNDTMVDPREQAFFTRISSEVPKDSVIANNPWDGSGLIWALADRRPLFPHLDIAWSAEQRYLAQHLVSAASDPTTCKDARLLHVDYLVVGELHFWPTDPRIKNYSGIVDPAGRPGFQLVDSDGDLKLYKLTAC